MAKQDTTKQDTTKQDSTKRKSRTIEERIAELEELQRKRAEKRKAVAAKTYDDKVAAFERTIARAHKQGEEIARLVAEHDFDLPAFIENDALADQAIPDYQVPSPRGESQPTLDEAAGEGE